VAAAAIRRASERVTAERIDTLTRHIKTHTARVADIMRANIDRWRLE